MRLLCFDVTYVGFKARAKPMWQQFADDCLRLDGCVCPNSEGIRYKIAAIKEYRRVSLVGLLEAKKVVERYLDKEAARRKRRQG